MSKKKKSYARRKDDTIGPCETLSRGSRTRSGSKTSGETRARVVAALLSGAFDSDTQISIKIGISKSTVSRIRRSISRENLKQAETLKKERIETLIADHLESMLKAEIRINAVISGPEWIARQDAKSLAILYGIKFDRIFGALQKMI
jgi:hypothetical protein